MPTKDALQILRLARAYAAAKGHTLGTVSLRIGGSGTLFGRLERDETDLTLKRRDRILQAFSDNWPAGCAWPGGVERPAPRAEAA